ncbi:ribonuclease h [Diplodia corticola]|uniref:Ribonuclease H n=1 Tax=Diplodia corticola TaxID=236234 RepID=A0A1J9QIL6_9PEZI|nr:ribonuclease h [Diplodia corticola]OJD28694.1 ribonuclease h [Diplodia corticola]
MFPATTKVAKQPSPQSAFVVASNSPIATVEATAVLLLRLALRVLPPRRTIEQLLGGLGNDRALQNTLKILEQARAAQRRNPKIRLNLEYRIKMAKDKVSPAVDEERSNATTSNASSKRKRGNEPKFYAVKDGRKPGVYANWNDCLDQVKGFKGAIYKSFPSAAEAEAFVSGTASNDNPEKFYAVQSGRVPGVYTDWPSAQKQTTGWTRPKYKAFPTRAEAEAFVKAGKKVGESVSNVAVEPDAQSDTTVGKKSEPPAKRQKKSAAAEESAATNSGPSEPGTGSLPEGAEDGFDPRVILNPETGKVEWKTEEQLAATKKMPTGESKGGMLRIYTDGSSLGNGKKGSVAGVGVFFGPLDKRNVSEGLAGPRQTNQRAELTAIQRALDITPLQRDVTIFSDSNYSINCVTVWFVNWRKNNWVTASKKPVENKDLVETIIARIEEREKLGSKTIFTWLKGHADDPGNIAADELAVQGARNAQAALREA